MASVKSEALRFASSMKTPQFAKYTPKQIAEQLLKLPKEELADVLKCLTIDNKQVAERNLAILRRQAAKVWNALPDAQQNELSTEHPSETFVFGYTCALTQAAAFEKEQERRPTLVDAPPFENAQGEQCGLCDGTHAHEHPQLQCRSCGAVGLTENMRAHECKGKTLMQVFAEEAEVKMAQRFAGEYSEMSQRLEQLSLNQRWLIERISGIHRVLCPDHIATWQESAIQAETAAHKLAKACEPIAHFITQWERMPLARQADMFYGIHNGTEYEANLTLSNFRQIRDLLRPKKTVSHPITVSINGKKVEMTGDDCMALTYQRVVNLADTQWGKKALHTITFYDRATGHNGTLTPGRSIVPTEGMSITAVVTGAA